MKLNESEYNKIFIEQFQCNKDQFHREFERVVLEHGYSEEIKLAFYKAAFKNFIELVKKDLNKDEAFASTVIKCYDIFLRKLQDDLIDIDDITIQRNNFINLELPKIKVSFNSKPETKQYNLNTKYGRRKSRDQANRNYENGTPEYRKEIDNLRTFAFIIIIVIAVIVYMIKYSK